MADVTKQLVRRYIGLDADKANADLNTGDHYYATDTGINYTFDGTVYRGGFSHIRRLANAADFDETDFTADGAWHIDGLDLSAIVPAGATVVFLKIQVTDDAANSTMNLRKDAAGGFDSITVNTQVANIPVYENQPIPINANRLLDYNLSNLVFTSITVVVVGWFI